MNDKTENEEAGLDLDDPDRLPWLETADGYEYDGAASPLKVAGFVLGGLALLAAIVGGIYWAQRDKTGGQGNGELIAAQEGDYKVRPEEAGGKNFEGEGDAAFAASEGKAVPAGAPAPKTDDKSKATAPAKAAPPAKASASAAAPAGSVFVQLGAFGDAAKADTAWGALGKRFGFLSGVNRRVAEGTSEGGRKVFRLQAVTANSSAAQQLCAKLKAAGENCLIVK